MILTSNRGFAEWGEVFGNAVVATALLDRLLHHAVVIQIGGPATARASMSTCCPRLDIPSAPVPSSRSRVVVAGPPKPSTPTPMPPRPTN